MDYQRFIWPNTYCITCRNRHFCQNLGWDIAKSISPIIHFWSHGKSLSNLSKIPVLEIWCQVTQPNNEGCILETHALYFYLLRILTMGLCCRGRSPFPCLQEKRENDVKKNLCILNWRKWIFAKVNYLSLFSTKKDIFVPKYNLKKR